MTSGGVDKFIEKSYYIIKLKQVFLQSNKGKKMKTIIKFLPEEISRIFSHPELTGFFNDVSGRLPTFKKRLVLKTFINKKNIDSEREIDFAYLLPKKITEEFVRDFHLIPQMIEERCENAFLIIAVDFLGDYDVLLGRLEIIWQIDGVALIIINNSDNFAGTKINFGMNYQYIVVK